MSWLLPLLLCIGHAADILVPSEHDPLAWARAWASVVEALQDPSLRDARVIWEPSTDQSWTLTVEHNGQRARLSGLTPAGTPPGRLEQLYVAVSLLSVGAGGGSLDQLLAPPEVASPTPHAAPPGNPEPATVPPPGPQAEPGSLPPPDQPLRAGRPAARAAEVPLPLAVARDRGPVLLTLLALPGEGVIGLVGGAVQGTWQPTWFGLGLRGVAVYDRDVRPSEGRLPVTGRVHEWRFEAVSLAMARAWTYGRFALTVGTGAGVSVRNLGVSGQNAGTGPVPVGRAQLGLEVGGRNRVRIELSLTRDLRAVEIDFGQNRSVRLPGTRPQVALGCTLGGRR